jgi:hypothetical protein
LIDTTLYPWIHHHHPHGIREMGKPTSLTFYIQSKKSGPRSHHDSFHLHGMIKPVLSLYSFLRTSCFLDWLPGRHHQAQFWLSNVHLHDLSMTSFALPSAFVVPANQVSSDPSRRPRTWRMASFAYTVSRTPCLSVNSPL